MPAMTFNQMRAQNMQRDANIPGSVMWIMSKNGGQMPQPPITRNSLKFDTAQPSKPKFVTEDALSNGWELNSVTKKWRHSSYPNVEFDSIVQNTVYGPSYLPYSGDQDPLGIAYNFTVSGDGLHKTVYENKWKNEDFDTRRGRRRNLWEEKKELRKKHALEFMAYQENRRNGEVEEDGFENAIMRNREENGDDSYNRDFVIN